VALITKLSGGTAEADEGLIPKRDKVSCPKATDEHASVEILNLIRLMAGIRGFVIKVKRKV